MKGVIFMLGMQEVKSYLYTLNAVKYHYDMADFNRRSDFVYEMCAYYGYLSYGQVVDMFETC